MFTLCEISLCANFHEKQKTHKVRANCTTLSKFRMIRHHNYFITTYVLSYSTYDHSKAVIGGNFLGMVLNRLRFFKSHNSNGAPRKETMKYCFRCETRIMSIGGSSDLCDLKATECPVRISVWFNSFLTKLEDPPERLWWAWLRMECKEVHSIPRTCKN